MNTQEITLFKAWKVANRKQLRGFYQELTVSGNYNGISFNEFCATCYMPSIPIDFLTEEVVNTLIEDIIEIDNKIQKLRMRHSKFECEHIKSFSAETILLARKVVREYRSVINNLLNTY